jgi:thiol:disulfide interchange protein DsbA
MRPQGRLEKGWVAFTLAVLVGGASAQAQLGRDFIRLDPPRPAAAGSRIEVIEFFYYGCPVCYETQPILTQWLVSAPEYVALRRVPALASATWEPFAKLFYTLETLDQVGRLHWPVYDNFHFDDVKLNEENTMADWVARNGIDRQKFLDTYGSAEVATKVAQARELLNAYDVRGVPAFVVDGKFLTSARLAGGTKPMMQVLDHLVKLAREERPR